MIIVWSLAIAAGVVVCLALQAFFSGTEIAMTSADRIRLQTRAQNGDTRSQMALDLIMSEDQLLGTCLIGTNLTLVTGTTLVAMLLSWSDVNLPLGAALVYTPIALIFGEVLSKTVFQFHANMLVPYLARPIRTAQLLFWPLLRVVSAWSSALELLLGSSRRRAATREEIIGLLDHPGPGSIAPDDKQLIRRLFEITQTSIEDCMTPLIDMHALPAGASIDDAIEVAIESGHSRLPIFQDRIDNIVGVVQVRDLLAHNGTDLVMDVMRAPQFVPESKKAGVLLQEMRKRSDRLAVVVDEYGGSVGVITIEDLLEEVVGEIRDERDEDEPSIIAINEREWRMPARVELDELEEVIGHTIPEGDYETVAGLVLAHEGRIPTTGETIVIGLLRVHIEHATPRAIQAVRIELLG
ncbi:MAG: putative hemolysin [Kiritimatiellia bacterium]|jgi:putative hemolysin